MHWGDLNTALSGLFEGASILLHFILYEHGGFFQNKNKDITSYMMSQMIFIVIFVLSPQTPFCA